MSTLEGILEVAQQVTKKERRKHMHIEAFSAPMSAMAVYVCIELFKEFVGQQAIKKEAEVSRLLSLIMISFNFLL